MLSLDYFNSHPHKEDDEDAGAMLDTMNISTHILTRRMTVRERTVYRPGSISTHILTRRMTSHGNSRTHERAISTHILTRRMT